MSRFADPNTVKRFVIGPCECPGTPHTTDWIDLRTEIGAKDSITIAIGGNYAALRTLAKAWNLQDDESGVPAPLDDEHFDRLLMSDLWDKLDAWLTENTKDSAGTLPNESAGPSVSTTTGTLTPIPNPRKAGSSMTLSSPGADGVTTTSGSQPLTS